MGSGAGIDEWVARRLRELRAERGMTLSALAEQVGISAPHLSRLEKGERQPSIGTLLQIARVYGVTVSHLVEELDDADHHVVRATDAVRHQGRDGSYTVLSGPRADISVVRLDLVPGRATTPARHAGEEWLHVVAGTVHVTIDDESLVLDTGDSVHFDSARPHQVSSTGPATVMIASTASTAAHHPIPRR